MYRTNAPLVMLCVILTLTFGLVSAWGQDKDSPRRARPADHGKTRHIAYVVQNGSARELADILAKHFKGEAEIQVLTDSPGQCLLISAARPVVDEVLKVLALHDRRRQMVTVEVLVAEFERNKADGAKKETGGTNLDTEQFKGPTDKVVANLEELHRKGKLSTLQRLQMTLVEGQPSSLLLGQSKPYVTGVTKTATGVLSRSISFRNLGTQLKATARVAAKDKIEIDLDLSESRAVPDDTIVIGKDEAGTPIQAMDFVTSKVTTKVSLVSGQAVAAEGVKTASKAGRAQTVVVVAATIVNGSAGADKDDPAIKRPRKGRRRPRD
jgi:hypothetical protein